MVSPESEDVTTIANSLLFPALDQLFAIHPSVSRLKRYSQVDNVLAACQES